MRTPVIEIKNDMERIKQLGLHVYLLDTVNLQLCTIKTLRDRIYMNPFWLQIRDKASFACAEGCRSSIFIYSKDDVWSENTSTHLKQRLDLMIQSLLVVISLLKKKQLIKNIFSVCDCEWNPSSNTWLARFPLLIVWV